MEKDAQVAVLHGKPLNSPTLPKKKSHFPLNEPTDIVASTYLAGVLQTFANVDETTTSKVQNINNTMKCMDDDLDLDKINVSRATIGKRKER